MLPSVDALRLAGSCSLQGRTDGARDGNGRTSLLKMGDAYERSGAEEDVICVTGCVPITAVRVRVHFGSFVCAK